MPKSVVESASGAPNRRCCPESESAHLMTRFRDNHVRYRPKNVRLPTNVAVIASSVHSNAGSLTCLWCANA